MAKSLVAFNVFCLIDEEATVLPGVQCKFVRPSELPKTGNFFVVSRDKMWQNKSTSTVKGLVTVKTISILAEELVSKVDFTLPKIPALIIARAHKFFSTVYALHHSESELMLTFNQDTREYDLWCPEQEVSHCSVHYQLTTDLIGNNSVKVVGTIHSHSDFGAFHSGTDTHDELHRDGIHITIGNVNLGSRFSMVSSLVVNENRWQVPCENVVNGIKSSNTDMSNANKIWISSQNYFSLEMSEGELAKFEEYKQQIGVEWMAKVKKKVWATGTGNLGFLLGRSENANEIEPYQNRFGRWEDGRWIPSRWKANETTPEGEI